MSSIRRFSFYALAYLLWAVSIVLGGMALFQIREAYLYLITVSTFNRFKGDVSALFYKSLQQRTLDTWSYLLLGILLIVLIVFLEHYYRTGVQPGTLRIRFFQVTTLEFALLFIANLMNEVVVWMISSFTWRSLFYPVLELIVAGIFIWLWLDTSRHKPVVA